MYDMKRIKTISLSLLLLSIWLSLVSCAKVEQRICIKDGRPYCITSDRIYVVNWDACYRRGVNCMEGECWNDAIEEFQLAIERRSKDQRDVRAYGMHFREEYFPHRELGVCYYHLGKIPDAMEELELSMSQTPSARAKYYLNQVRRSHLLSTGEDLMPPVIRLDFPEEAFWTNHMPVKISGVVQDDQYVGAISVNQTPFFMELAEPAIPFSLPIALEEGWITIRIQARDLVDRLSEKQIRIYFDRQAPTVIANPIQPDQVFASGQLILSAVIYDKSGIMSIQINQKEVPRFGLDQLCLIEEVIPLTPGLQKVPFIVTDRAGNMTKGEIPLFQESRKKPDLSLRMASKDVMLGMIPQENGISFDITYPPEEDLTTYYHEIFFEGRIETRNGIKRITLNDEQVFDISDLQGVILENMQNLVQMLNDQNKEPERYIRMLQETLERYNIYHLNQRIHLEEEFTVLHLSVEDSAGNQGSRLFHIQKIPREEVFKSEERMVMALLPLDSMTEKGFELQHYISNKLLESFYEYDRFNLVEREKLPWIMIEKMIQTGGKIYKDDAAQQIGEIVSAEGVICGYIQKRADGTEILARFVEVDTGLIRLFHDVFTPSEDVGNINLITSGLAMKFCTAFPICTGTIIGKKGNHIHVDLGSEKSIFPGMGFNIFRDERELIGKAYIRDTFEGYSEAEVSGNEKNGDIALDDRVRTR